MLEDDESVHAHDHYETEPSLHFPAESTAHVHSHARIRPAADTIATILDAAAAPLIAAGTEFPELCDFRGALYAVIDDPRHATWDAAYKLPIITTRFDAPLTLWQTLQRFSAYKSGDHVPGTIWAKVPSSPQIILALHDALNIGSFPRIPVELGPWEIDDAKF
ncbi:hypothetical protein [Leucobacter sp. cx-169]|uniref:hypothetical protein n=1 Tax=Leucobacter sp. cx-169 TaxID=2770549 RepID=UPI00165D56D2|nr:hypothetical protein [Leucobacter sp. cx-169]MBC9927365.1 hypothetical protein [Leucobacter sp. cx-169]